MLPAPFKTLLLTAMAMLAFAANSLLCRQALDDGSIDAASFTALRLVSGTLMLWLLVHRRIGVRQLRPKAAAAGFLFLYAAAFSFAYRYLTAATGALILFGAVQLTMMTAALRARESFPPLAWTGLVLSLAGLIYLVAPGLSAPPLTGALLMALSGFGWGMYSLRGRGVGDPLAATAANFTGAAPLALLLCLPFAESLQVTATGVLLATASGALASGLGYVIWYAALSGLSAGAAAGVQLSVPVLAAIGGVLLLSEPMTLRLTLASLLVLGGIALVFYGKQRARRP